MWGWSLLRCIAVSAVRSPWWRGARDWLSVKTKTFPKSIKTILEDERIKIRLRAECIAFEKRGDKVAVQVDCSSGDKTVIGSHALLAVGRVPNTNDLGLDTPGSKSMSAVTSRLTINFAPMCPAFMRWVIATDEEPSLIPHTTIMKLSSLIF